MRGESIIHADSLFLFGLQIVEYRFFIGQPTGLRNKICVGVVGGSDLVKQKDVSAMFVPKAHGEKPLWTGVA